LTKFLLTFLLSFTLFISAYAEDNHVVERGDTLWDLSGKYYGDEFMWPVIWKNNVRINDPDLIYPKQKLNIPYFKRGGEVLKLKRSEQMFQMGSDNKAMKNTAANYNSAGEIKKYPGKYKAASYMQVNDYETITKKEIATNVVSTEDGKFFVSFNDKFIIDGGENNHYSVGDCLTIYERLGKIKNIGFLYRVVGYADISRVDEKSSRAVLKKSFSSITKGYAVSKCRQIAKKEPSGYKSIISDINGVVIYISNSLRHSAKGVRVVTDLGLNDGLKSGDIVRIVKRVTEDGYVKQSTIAEGQVINIGSDYSTVRILYSNKEISKGDKVFIHKVAVF